MRNRNLRILLKLDELVVPVSSSPRKSVLLSGAPLLSKGVCEPDLRVREGVVRLARLERPSDSHAEDGECAQEDLVRQHYGIGVCSEVFKVSAGGDLRSVVGRM